MVHSEYRRIVKDADTAILFLHGIAGTPNHFLPFLKEVPEEYSLVNLLLEGHGKSVRDFSRASMAGWEAQVGREVEELAEGHDRIFLVAHSMGTLLAVEQALREPKIRRLFLLAVPLRLGLRPRLAVNCAKVFFDRVPEDDPWAKAARDCYGIAMDRNLLHYLGWIPRYLELLGKMKKTRKALSMLRTPGMVFQSARDEMVSVRSVSDLKKAPTLSVTVLERSGHYYYPPEELGLLQARFRDFLVM